MTHRTDTNQRSIIDCFRKLGYSILNLSQVGNGCVDIEIAKHGVNDLIEIKTIDGKLSEAQIQFAQRWNAPVYVIRSVDDAIRFNEGYKLEFEVK